MTLTATLLFLDFDGVLHPTRSEPSQHFIHLPRFESILRDCASVSVVISSTWQDAYSLGALRRRFSQDIAARIIGGTRSADPDCEVETRYEQIKLFLRHVGRSAESWVALDDAEDEFPARCPQLILCDSQRAFDLEAERRLRERLLFAR